MTHSYLLPRCAYPLFAAALYAFLAAFLFQQESLAGETLTIDSDEQFTFAETYFNEGAFRQAIDEYRRFIYFFPKDSRVDTARFRIGQSHMKSNDFTQGIASFKPFLNRPRAGDLFIKSYRLTSECHVKLRQYDAAVSTLENLIARVEDPGIKDEANYRIGWIYIETGAFETARDYFGRIRPQTKTRFDIDRLFTEMEKAPLIEKKSPFLAGTLSIVPGLGYLYCNRPKDALVSFIVNGGMIFATYAAVDNDNPALGAILAFLGLGFYSANIYGSVTSAHKFNRRKKEDFIQNLKQNTRIHLSSIRRNRGALLTLQYRF